MFKIELTKNAEKFFLKLWKSHPEMARRVANALEQIAKDPEIGTPLKAKFKGLYKYRVGTYRIIYQICRSQLIVTVIDIGHLKEIYR